MKKDESGIATGTIGQSFIQGEKVMIRRFGDGMEYRAKIAGIAVDVIAAKIMICEIVDPFTHDYPFSHVSITEACIDKESWIDD